MSFNLITNEMKKNEAVELRKQLQNTFRNVTFISQSVINPLNGQLDLIPGSASVDAKI